MDIATNQFIGAGYFNHAVDCTWGVASYRPDQDEICSIEENAKGRIFVRSSGKVMAGSPTFDHIRDCYRYLRQPSGAG